MNIFLDTSKVAEIEKWLAHGVIEGVTTNPSIMLKDGQYNLEANSKKIASIIYPSPVSIEVYSSIPKQMLQQARIFARWAENIVVKIAVITERGEPCLEVIKTLEDEGIRVNCTVCMSFGQAMLGVKAGASYVSIFVGRINDEGNDGPKVVQMTRKWIDEWNYKSKIIAGSIRSVMDIQQVAIAGTHVITIPPELMSKLVDHKYSRITVQQFLEDGQKAFNGSVLPTTFTSRSPAQTSY